MDIPQVTPNRNVNAPAPYIDYSEGPYSNSAVQQFLSQMTGGRWNTQWEDPNMTSAYTRPGGGSITLGSIKGLSDKAIQDFTTQVQAVAGRPPTADEINQFFSSQLNPMTQQSQPGGYDPIHPQDITSAIQQYVPTAFSQPIQDYQQTQQTNALNKNIASGEDLISKAMGQFSGNLTDPNNPMYQQFSGNMNNLGITPSSGAFAAGLGGTIANQGNQLQQQLMSSLGFPALKGIQGISDQANQNLQGAAPLAQANLTKQQTDLGDFGRMQAIAQMLQQQMEPSTAQKDIGMASGAANAFGNLTKGGATMAGMTWICTAMVNHGVMTKAEVKTLHDHLFKAFWKKPFKFVGYFVFGKLLVLLAESVRTDWRVWKPSFYQDVMAEADPVKALALYEEAFWHLYSVARYRKVWLGC